MAIYPVCTTCGTYTPDGDGSLMWDTVLGEWTVEDCHSAYCSRCDHSHENWNYLDTDTLLPAQGEVGDQRIVSVLYIDTIAAPTGRAALAVAGKGDSGYFVQAKESVLENINAGDIVVLKKLPSEDGFKESWVWEIVTPEEENEETKT